MRKLLARLTAVFVLLALAFVSPITGNAAEPSYILPAVPGSQIHVEQGNGGKVSHQNQGQYAFDFTPQFNVAAARSGRVIDVKNDSDTYCNARRCWLFANHILVDHGDGTSSLYMHLEKGSVLVNVGDQISQRQKLALVGLSGWTTGLHLHFQVEKTPSEQLRKSGYAGWWYTQSVPIKFSSPEVLEQSRSTDGVPKQGQTFTVSGKKPSSGTSPTRSTAPTVSPTPGKNASPSKSVGAAPRATASRPVPVPRPTPSKSNPPPQTGNISVRSFWTENFVGTRTTAVCSGSDRYVRYNLILVSPLNVPLHMTLTQSWGGTAIDQDVTLDQVTIFGFGVDLPAGLSGTYSYTMKIGSTYTKTGTITC